MTLFSLSRSRSRGNLRWLTVLVFAASAQAQIPQNRPELCGKHGQTVPLPDGTTFSYSDGLPSDLTLKLMDGTAKTVDLQLADGVPQVCPIAGSRLLVFGTVAGEDGPHVWIVSQIDGSVLDHIGSRGPVVSPDQHWLIYRQFYPRNVEIVAEFYFLYDLTSDMARNRPRQQEPGHPVPAGRQVYPVTANHLPLGHAESLEPLHEFESESFFWSPDSQFVAFADATSDAKSIVLVKVGNNNLITYTHTLKENEICGGRAGMGGVLGPAMLHSIEFVPAEAPLPDIWATFSQIRCEEPLRLHAQDFKPAEIEIHKRIQPPKK